jgi:uncharacterized protein (DUF302 family)
MGFIRNLLALIGLAVVAACIYGYVQYGDALGRFDPGAGKTYLQMARDVLEKGSAVEATAWKVPLEEGVTAEDAELAMKTVANELNISNVGELPLSKDVAAKSGKPYRFVKIFMFCNSLTAAQMMDYSDAYSAYLPCRVTLLEDKQGKYWIYSLNMDLMIHGGKPLPPALKKEALKVKGIIQEIMQRGAAGDF